MIRKVVLRRFKRFQEQEFLLDGHVVLAGPNNMGKTTVLQAIAAWDLAINHWKLLNDFQRHGGGYTKAPIARQAFMAVLLRNFDLMWTDRRYDAGVAEVEVQTQRGETVTMEFIPDSTEQIYVRPKRDATPQLLRELKLRATYIPPMSGLSVEEPVYQRPKIDQWLALQKPGDVLRNLLVEVHLTNQAAWQELAASIQRLFSCELLPPNPAGADILAEFRNRPDTRPLDIRSGGSGFQQVLMLLAFLHTRPGAVLLIDEPDAHLHVYLQDTIYSELRHVAAKTNSQLIVATHSEIIVNAVAPSELCAVYLQPKRLSDATDQRRLAESLRILSQTEVVLALDAPGILYVEGHTDLELLKEWARSLNHPAKDWLATRPFWRPTVAANRDGGKGVPAKDHFDALQLVRPDLPGLEMIDGDAHPGLQSQPVTGRGFQRQRWQRYEIESYLFHPAALARYVTHLLGANETPAVAEPNIAQMNQWMNDNLPPAVVRDPLGDHAFLRNTKARTEILPPLLAAAGFAGVPYTHYSEIAALMRPEEIHPEVGQKLDAIRTALRL